MCQCGFCCPLIPGSSRHSDLCPLFNMYNIFKLLSQSKKKKKSSLPCSLKIWALHQRLPERGRSTRDLGDVHTPLLFLLSYQTLSSVPCSLQIHPLLPYANQHNHLCFPPYNMLYENSALLLSTVIGTTIILTQCTSLHSNFYLCVE